MNIQFDVKPDAFRCMVQGWLQTAHEKQVWQRLILNIVIHAFAGRPASFVTTSPMEWSFGHALPRARTVSRESHRYLVNELDVCSTSILAEVAESEDFQRGLLYILAASANESDLLGTVAQLEATALELPCADRESLLLLDDGRAIHWLSPGRDTELLQRELSENILSHDGAR